MPDLLQTLQDHDLGHLRVVAELWGIELPPESALEIAKSIASKFSSREFIAEIEGSLPESTRGIWHYLLDRDGKVAMADLVRIFGEIREMGPGRRDREKPWRKPISPLEDLWYHGLCAKMFVDTHMGVEEFVIIPSEFMAELVPTNEKKLHPLGRPGTYPDEVIRADTFVVDDVTTLLAHLRKTPAKSLQVGANIPQEIAPFCHRPESIELLLTLLIDLGLVESHTFEPMPSKTKDFLDRTIFQIQHQLLNAWRDSVAWNDLARVPGLSATNDEWPNDPVIGRQRLLQFFLDLPSGEWWDLEEFIRNIRSSAPSFLRQPGGFESWYLFESESEEFLRGFEYWEQVEGELIRFIIRGPLHWLGLVDFGKPAEIDRVVAFRLTDQTGKLFKSEFSNDQSMTEDPIRLLPDGLIRASTHANRAYRYQISRFTNWVSFDGNEYTYRITPQSLKDATEHGMEVKHFRSILISSCESMPPAISDAISRWELKGVEAEIEKALILRVADPEILQFLQSNRRTSKYMLEILSPTSAVILEGSQTKLYEAAVKNGFFINLPGKR